MNRMTSQACLEAGLSPSSELKTASKLLSNHTELPVPGTSFPTAEWEA